jgi:hypothetical protein
LPAQRPEAGQRTARNIPTTNPRRKNLAMEQFEATACLRARLRFANRAPGKRGGGTARFYNTRK